MTSFLTEFPMLTKISDQHQCAFMNIYSEVLRIWKDANSEEETTRALKWLGCLSQCLQRKSPSRRGKGGRNEIARRYNCAIEKDWNLLVILWEKDCERRQRKQVSREGRDKGLSDEKLRKEVLGMMSAGQISRALK